MPKRPPQRGGAGGGLSDRHGPLTMAQTPGPNESLIPDRPSPGQLSSQLAYADLAKIGQIVTSTPDIGDVYQQFDSTVARLIPFDRISISTLDLETNEVINSHVAGAGPQALDGTATRRLDDTTALLVARSVSGLVACGDEYERLAGEYSVEALHYQAGFRSKVSVPLLYRGDVIGVLSLRSRSPNAYTEDHLQSATEVGNQISGALYNSAMVSRLGEMVRERDLLARIGRIVTSTPDMDDVYRQFAAAVAERVAVDRINVTVLGGSKDAIRVAYLSGEDIPGSWGSWQDMPMSGTTEEQALLRGPGIWDLTEEIVRSDILSGELESMEAGFRSVITVPLLSMHETVAFLTVASKVERAYSEEDLQFLCLVGDQVAGAVATSLLVTELQRTHEELKRSNADLEQFAYVASHDLQEPLRMVSSYVTLLERRYQGRLDADADDFIHFAVDGAERMRQLIQDLLAFSRVGTRGGELVPTESRAALTRALENLQVLIDEAGARVIFEEMPEVNADPGQLELVFQNLIGNAIKYRGEDRPKVTVSALAQEGHWLFRVSDNGIGFEQKFADRIFGVFQRLQTRSEYPGTGIGLAIVKKIVERHGGRIWAESQPGLGSTFLFTMPASGDGYGGQRLE